MKTRTNTRQDKARQSKTRQDNTIDTARHGVAGRLIDRRVLWAERHITQTDRVRVGVRTRVRAG